MLRGCRRPTVNTPLPTTLPTGETGTGGALGRVLTPTWGVCAGGLIDGAAALSGRVLLTLRGRLLADYVTREIMGY